MKKISTVGARQTRNFREQQLTIGLDLGDRSSWYCVLDEGGEVLLEQRLGTTPKAMKEVFGEMPRSLGAEEERKQDQKSRATAPFPSWRNGDRSVLAVKGSLRRKERALDRSGPLCTPSAMREREILGKANQNLLDADRHSHGRP